MVDPIVKYAGGKRRLAQRIVELLGLHLGDRHRYAEPFCGGAAVALAVRATKPKIAVELGDASAPLMEAYFAVTNAPQIVADELSYLAECYSSFDHLSSNRDSYYYAIRSQFNAGIRNQFNAGNSPPDKRAAEFLFLNRTCFNGLWRVNKDGEFNVPHGKYARPAFPTAEHLAAWAAALDGARLLVWEFQTDVNGPSNDYGVGDAIYADPPYHSEGDEAFVGYAGQFGLRDQDLLCAKLTRDAAHGARVVASNRATKEIVQMYGDRGWTIEHVGVQHSVGATGARRGKVDEVLMSIGPGLP